VGTVTSVRNPALSFRPEPGSIPDEPGCYQFKDAHSRVIYVGKAKSLRSRLSNYFGQWHAIPARTRAMLEAARSLEWIVVDNEIEALHLEYTLIQRHKPRYNVRYRDDKSYPYLVLTTSEEVPRARVQRGKIAAGDRRFGPFAHAYAIRETLDLLLRIFPVRTCSQGVFDRAKRNNRACLFFDIGKCAAPCVGEVTPEEHRELVAGLAAFLEGDTEPVVRRLETEMTAAADDLNFETAARLRDQLFDARKAMSKQQMASDKPEDFDAIAVWEDEIEAAVQVFFVRRGRVVGRKGWTVDKVEDLTTEALLTSFVLQLYEERPDDVPPLILVETEPEDADALGSLLAELRREHTTRGRPIDRVTFRVPRRGSKQQVMQTVRDNAREAFERHRLKRASDFNARSQALRELQEQLDLGTSPLRIECYDISHLGGTEVVASMVVFEDGLPRKSEYRRFKLSQDRNDDFAAMREVIRRRFARLAEEYDAPERGKFAYPPSLVVIDGGPGQLAAAQEGVRQVDATGPVADVIGEVAFVSLAKRHEELFLPGRPHPIALPRGSDALYLVQRIRDEAHRFAITFQRKRRTRSVTTTELDGIAGIGPERRKALLRRFGSVKAIRESPVDEIASVPGISETLAERVKQALG
jgi:excinuclease ABC subunit C